MPCKSSLGSGIISFSFNLIMMLVLARISTRTAVCARMENHPCSSDEQVCMSSSLWQYGSYTFEGGIGKACSARTRIY